MLVVYMTSMGGPGWEGDGERELSVTFFDQVLTPLRNEAKDPDGGSRDPES